LIEKEAVFGIILKIVLVLIENIAVFYAKKKVFHHL
jgi:hypothetical protein